MALDTKARNEERLAAALGWFSIGLGLAEVLAPGAMARALGFKKKSSGLLRLFGLREIAAGVGILTQSRPTPWLWARVAGDALDLASLGTGFISSSARGRLAAASAAVAGVTALDVVCSQRFTRRPDKQLQPINVRRAITINASPEDIYRRWRQFEELPGSMSHLHEVRSTTEKVSHWVAKGPGGTKVEWDAEVVEDRPNELIRWRSLPGSTVQNQGEVRFERASGNRGTIVRVELEYRPPAGVLGAGVAKLAMQSPEKQIAVDLLRFKQLVETGEIARTEGQPSGVNRGTRSKVDTLVRS